MPSDNSHVYKLQKEIENVIYRYKYESNLTIAELLGVLELLKYAHIEATFREKKED